FIVIVAMQPDVSRVSRSASMTTLPEVPFRQVNDFHNWEAWSPWAKLDPQAKESFEGPSAGNGAVFHWCGNRRVGEGSMVITERRPNNLIHIKADFVRPVRGSNDVEFTFRRHGIQTIVTWTMTGHQTFLGKALTLFVNCDKSFGGCFERGLAQLRAIVE